MKLKQSDIKGFSLLEIMIGVAIVSIMASSVVIGFNSFGETVRTRETAGVITDTLKNLELEMIRREYVQQTVSFQKDYLVLQAEVAAQTPASKFALYWQGPGGSCGEDEENLYVTNDSSPAPVYLAKRDAEGNNLSIDAVTDDKKTFCVPFADAEETEWQYQLFNGSEHSQVIRFLHFNIRRGDHASGQVGLTEGVGYTLNISAPYGDKTFYDDQGKRVNGPVTFKLKNGGPEETITLQ